MAKKRITSQPGLLGYVYHYDENGKCIGKSRPGLLHGTTVYYNAKDKKIGSIRPGFLAKEVYHDEENDRYISTYDGIAGDVHFDNGTPLGTSYKGLYGTKYTTLYATDETSEDYLTEDEFEKEDLQEFSQHNESDRKTVLTNIIVFAVCCLIVGIIVLIFNNANTAH